MPGFSRNFFTFFGLEPSLHVDADALQKRFYELSRTWHPDRFVRKSAPEQAEALDATSVLNDAYRTLRDPIQRAEYTLNLAGFPIGEQRSKDVPPELLEEVFELNMMLEELRGGDESARPQLESARSNFLVLEAKVDADLQQAFSVHDAAPAGSEARQSGLQNVRGLLNRRRYIENLLRDVDRALNPAVSTTPESVDDRL